MKIKKYMHFFQGWKLYHRDLRRYKKLEKDSRYSEFKIYGKNKLPVVYDRFEMAGKIDGHYFFQDIFMAKEIFKCAPKDHFDIGSRLDGFITHLLSFRENVTMIDIRPLPFEVMGLTFLQSDATNLSEIESSTVESISSLHAIEHFGLGRYGDPVDPAAWEKVLYAMQRVTKTGGRLYISVPIGRKNVLCFNAHRVFEIHTIPRHLDKCKLVKFAYIKEGKIIEVDLKEFPSFQVDADYLCGCYIFEKS